MGGSRELGVIPEKTGTVPKMKEIDWHHLVISNSVEILGNSEWAIPSAGHFTLV